MSSREQSVSSAERKNSSNVYKQELRNKKKFKHTKRYTSINCREKNRVQYAPIGLEAQLREYARYRWGPTKSDRAIRGHMLRARHSLSKSHRCVNVTTGIWLLISIRASAVILFFDSTFMTQVRRYSNFLDQHSKCWIAADKDFLDAN